MPRMLRERGLSLRSEAASDQQFLRRLYLSVRWQEFAATQWPDAVKQSFLASQFQIQTQQYQANYPTMARWIMEHTGEPMGRLYLHVPESEMRIVEISLLPEWRAQGIGGALLREVCGEADARRVPLSLHVERTNPAQRLYRRLGFEGSDLGDVYLHMERKVIFAAKR